MEITGPVDRKTVINALNCGANVFMGYFEDANTPTWDKQIQGQVNMCDAVRRRINFTDPNSGKDYALNDDIATLIVWLAFAGARRSRRRCPDERQPVRFWTVLFPQR